MVATAGGPSFPGSPLTWSLFFARQPEPDLEFTEEELEQTANIRSSPPIKPPKKKSGQSPLLWVLLLTLIGGGTYVAMEPELVMDLVGPLLGSTSEPPPIAQKPAPLKPPAQSPSPVQSEPSVTAPPTPAIDPLQANLPTSTPESASTAAPSMPAPQVPTPANRADSMAPPPASDVAPTITDSPSPLFAEGQRVTLLPNPGAPREKVALMRDAAGSVPGPAVPPGTVFTILDGDLRGNEWVYYVRSDYGTKGWLEEKQLQAKR